MDSYTKVGNAKCDAGLSSSNLRTYLSSYRHVLAFLFFFFLDLPFILLLLRFFFLLFLF